LGDFLKPITFFDFFSNIFDHILIPRDRILSAFSIDGETWKRERGVRKQKGGPFANDMVYYCFLHKPVDFNGDWEVYYHCSNQLKGKWTPKIIRARSTDGLNWIDFQKPVLIGPIDDLIFDQIRAPYLLKFNQGWRLYFSARGKDNRTRIHSIYSEDRNNWQIESEMRFDSELCKNLIDPKSGKVTDVTDPCVVYLEDGTMRAYFSTIHSSLSYQNIASARSSNGTEWEVEPGFRIQPGKKNMENCVCNPCVIKIGDEWRIFFRGADIYPLWNNIYTARSIDGLRWEGVKICLKYQRWNMNERNAVAFPFITKVENLGYRMYYTGYWGTLFDRSTIKHYMESSKKTLLSFHETIH
jgi:predicted GH43/DUF377 family glycosyl hydrolase